MLPEPRSVAELLGRRAALHPERLAFTFLADGEADERPLRYGELDRRARAVGRALRERVAAGERALLLYPPGIDFLPAFFGCQYAQVVAVPVYPPQPGKPIDRIAAITANARPGVVLTVEPVCDFFQTSLKGLGALAGVDWLTTDSLPERAAGALEPVPSDPQAVSFLQYTSGSTGTPKGVIVTHANVLHNQRMISAAFEDTEKSRGVSWLPLYHDMGLIGDVLQPLYLGTSSVLLSPLAFLERPVRWLRAISRTRATTSGGPNFAYEMCVRRIQAKQCEGLDLSAWTLAYNGSEPVRPDVMDRFVERFAAYGFRREAFYPCYGIAEATLIVSGGRRSAAPVVRRVDASELEAGRIVPERGGASARRLVGCGTALLDETLAIVDPERRVRCADGEVGEIWVASGSVAQGYFEQRAATAASFDARLEDTGEGGFLRTGDLGFVSDGELFVTGRRSDVLVVRGRNHYPQDIERSVELAHAAVRAGGVAAFLVEVRGEERLVVALELDLPELGDTAPAELLAQLRRQVAAQHQLHLYDVACLPPRHLPRTSSGKVRRRACRDAYRSGTLPRVELPNASCAGTGTRPPPPEPA